MQEVFTLIVSKYLRLISLQENTNGFKGLTYENRNFECSISDSNAIFLVSGKEILRISLDKELTNWVDYKKIAENIGLILDDSEVAVQLQSVNEAKTMESKPKSKTKTEVKAEVKTPAKAPARKAISPAKK